MQKRLIVEDDIKLSNALKIILDKLYDVTQTKWLPSTKKELDKYYAVILNDLPANNVNNADILGEYVIEGNGLFGS